MADIVNFRSGKPRRSTHLTLCRNGHHKWQVVKSDPFAVRQGRLISRYRCERCGKEKNEAR